MPNSFEKITTINAPIDRVWLFLTDISLMKKWMADPEMALEIETDWKIGSPIVMRGFHHAPFTNIGKVLEFSPPNLLAYTHLSSLSELADESTNYSTLKFFLSSIEGSTSIEFMASGFPTDSIFKHLLFYWGSTLEILKQRLEVDCRISQ